MSKTSYGVDWLAIPDTHAPGHHKIAWNAMVKAARVLKPRQIVIMGDFIDCYRLSKHARHPNDGPTAQEEFRVGNHLLDQLDSLGAERKFYLGGNHENRLNNYVRDRAPDLSGLLTIESALKLEQRRWKFLPYQRELKLGKIHFVHDIGFCGKYAVSQTMARYGSNVVMGHVHRLQLLFEGTAKGESYVGCCPGWLGDPESPLFDYMPNIGKRREWQHGFAVGRNDRRGNTHIQVLPIIGGQVVT